MAQSTNKFAEIADLYAQGAKQMVLQTTSELQAEVKSLILDKDIYDTGRMYRSVYTKTVEKSTYDHEDELIMPEIPDEADDYTAFVAVGAVYGAIQNYGGHGITGRPYWEPGLMRIRRSLDTKLVKIANKTREVSY
jgi:phage gpG-like protein